MTVLRGAGPTGEPGSGPDGADGYDVDWLELRAGADDGARATVLLDRLARRLPDRAHLLDVGCGAGAMQRWCAARLPAAPRWTLLDPDRALLAEATRRAPGGTVALEGSVTGLGAADLAGVDAVVCSALLDVLHPDQVDHLVAVVVEARVPLLAALTVTGEVRLDPPHRDDDRARRAVDRTATAGGAAGPAAPDLLRTAARRRGAVVVEEATPWRLSSSSHPGLLRAWADGYLAAAAAADASLVGWTAARRDDLAAGRLAATVAHVDVLVEPA